MMDWTPDDGRGEREAHAPRPHYLTFFIGREEFGIQILRVREIIELGAITQVPAAPPCVRGVINLRGSVVPIVDLAIKFGQSPCTATRFTCVVVVEVASDDEVTVMGLMVDAVNQTMELSEDEIAPVPSFGTVAPADYLVGMATSGEKFVLLLDIDRALSVEELRGATAVATLQELSDEAAPAVAEHGSEEPLDAREERETDTVPPPSPTGETTDV